MEKKKKRDFFTLRMRIWNAMRAQDARARRDSSTSRVGVDGVDSLGVLGGDIGFSGTVATVWFLFVYFLTVGENRIFLKKKI
jgi:hypothetical protein